MDGDLERKFSFPNSDRFNKNQSEEDAANELAKPKPLVHITDALNISKNENKDDAQTIRTFQNDIADAIKNDNVSMIKVALAEKKRQESNRGYDSVLEEKKSDVMFYVASIVVAIIVVAVFIGFIFFSTKPEGSTGNGQGSNSASSQLIYTESSTVIDTNNRDANDISRLVIRLRDGKFDLGTIKEIVFTTGTGTSTRRMTTGEWFKLMKARVDDSLIRSLDPNFEMGIYAFSNPYDTFAIFKVNSYDNAFAGMLQWENSMDNDVGDLFISRKLIAPSSTNSNNIIGANNQTEDAAPQVFGALKSREFIDKVIQNKDTRALVDDQGAVLMLYTFIGKDTLLIASGEKSLKEALFRLTTGRIVR